MRRTPRWGQCPLPFLAVAENGARTGKTIIIAMKFLLMNKAFSLLIEYDRKVSEPNDKVQTHFLGK